MVDLDTAEGLGTGASREPSLVAVIVKHHSSPAGTDDRLAHGCAEGGRRAHGECSRGAPDWKCRGAGLAPGSVQSLSGSRPIESSFLGRTWTGPGRVLRRLLPPVCRDPLRWKAGCSVRTSPAHPLGRQHLRGYSYYCTLFATFRSKIPLPTPTMLCALKGPWTPPGGGWRAFKRQRGTLGFRNCTPFPSLVAWGCTLGLTPQLEGEARWKRRGLSLISSCLHYRIL